MRGIKEIQIRLIIEATQVESLRNHIDNGYMKPVSFRKKFGKLYQEFIISWTSTIALGLKNTYDISSRASVIVGGNGAILKNEFGRVGGEYRG